MAAPALRDPAADMSDVTRTLEVIEQEDEPLGIGGFLSGIARVSEILRMSTQVPAQSLPRRLPLTERTATDTRSSGWIGLWPFRHGLRDSTGTLVQLPLLTSLFQLNMNNEFWNHDIIFESGGGVSSR